MDLWKVAETLAFLALAAYFVVKVTEAVGKLRDRRIATSMDTNHSKTAPLPGITYCLLRYNSKGQVVSEEDLLSDANRESFDLSDVLLGFGSGDSVSKPFARDFTAKVVPRRILWPGSKRNIFYSAVKCASFEADQEIDVGFAGIVSAYLNMTSHQVAMAFVYNRRDNHLPTFNDVYGNSYAYIAKFKANSSFFFRQKYYLHRTALRTRSRDSLVCDETNTSPPIDACIEAYIESEVGCSNAYQTSTKSRPPCTTTEQYAGWRNISVRITNAPSENEIYAMTGCLPSCERTEYVLESLEDVSAKLGNRVNNVLGVSPGSRIFWLRFYFKSGKYGIKEEYLVYDENSFIADVGGYLGLLLGHSLYSMFGGLRAIASYIGLVKNNK